MTTLAMITEPTHAASVIDFVRTMDPPLLRPRS
jgi:hypothetical protein